MIILIDGYNLLHAVFHRSHGAFESQRVVLIKELQAYRQAKNNEIIVVFDGGPERHATREVHKGVVIIFAGRRLSADEWIVDYVKRHPREDIVLVTRDREIIAQTASKYVDVIALEDFYALVRQEAFVNINKQVAARNQFGNIRKFAHTEDENYSIDEDERHAFDALMVEAAEGIQDDGEHDDHSSSRDLVKKRKISKVERRLVKKLGKL